MCLLKSRCKFFQPFRVEMTLISTPRDPLLVSNSRSFEALYCLTIFFCICRIFPFPLSTAARRRGRGGGRRTCSPSGCRWVGRGFFCFLMIAGLKLERKNFSCPEFFMLCVSRAKNTNVLIWNESFREVLELSPGSFFSIWLQIEFADLYSIQNQKFISKYKYWIHLINSFVSF